MEQPEIKLSRNNRKHADSILAYGNLKKGWDSYGANCPFDVAIAKTTLGDKRYRLLRINAGIIQNDINDDFEIVHLVTSNPNQVHHKCQINVGSNLPNAKLVGI